MREIMYGRRMSRDNTTLLFIAWTSSILFIFVAKPLLVLVVVLVSIILFGFNYYQMYIQYNDKYKQGHSFIKRKRKILGAFFWLTCIFLVVIFDLSYGSIIQMAEEQLIILFILLLVVLMIVETLISRAWYKFDKKHYQQIDEENPFQKSYFSQSRYLWNDGNEEVIDLELLKQKFNQDIYKSIFITGIGQLIIIGLMIILNLNNFFTISSMIILAIYIEAIYIDCKLFNYCTIFIQYTKIKGNKKPIRNKFFLSIGLLIGLLLSTPFVIVYSVIGLGTIFI